MAQRFSYVYLLHYKLKKLKFGASLITFHYDIFSLKIKYQNIIISNPKFSFIISKYSNFLKRVNIQ